MLTNRIITTCYLYIIILFILPYAHCNLVFHSPSEVSGITLRSNQFMFIGDSTKLDIQARLVVAKPYDGCDWEDVENKDDFEGNIVLIKRDDCSPADKFRTAQKGKAAAVIIYAEPVQYYMLAASYYLDTDGIDISGVEVRADDQDQYDLIINTAKDSSNYVNVTLTGDDPDLHMGYFVAFSVVNGIWAVINVGLAVWKFIGFVHKDGKVSYSLPQICLTIEILTNILRVVMNLEPDLGLGRGLIEFGTVGFLQSGNIIWSFVSTLLIAFYWDRSLKTFGRKRDSLNVFSLASWKIPLFVLSAFLILLDLASGTVRAMYFGTTLIASLLLIATAICVLGVAIFFTYNGYKVLKWAKQSHAIGQKEDTMSRMTRFVVVNAGGLYGIVIGLIIAANTETRTTWYIGYWIIVNCVNFVSSMQIAIFQPGETVGSSSGGTSDKSKSKNTYSDAAGPNIPLQDTGAGEPVAGSSPV